MLTIEPRLILGSVAIGPLMSGLRRLEKRRYLNHNGRASNTEKQPTGRGPEGCVENGPAAALLVGYLSIQICALPRALPTAHFERNHMPATYETMHCPKCQDLCPERPNRFVVRERPFFCPITQHWKK
jgi:hypothetical protein